MVLLRGIVLIVLEVIRVLVGLAIVFLVFGVLFLGVNPVHITVNVPQQPAPVVNVYGNQSSSADQQVQQQSSGQTQTTTKPKTGDSGKPVVVTGAYTCSDVTSPSVMFKTTDTRTVTGSSLVYPSGQGSKINKVFAVVLKEPGVIVYGQDGKGSPDLQKNVANGYAYWEEPGRNKFVLKTSEGTVTTLSGGQYSFVSFGEGIISLKGYEYLFGQKDRGMSGSTASRGWNVFIRTDGSTQDLNFRCVVPFENLTQLLPKGLTLSEDWAFQQIVNTHTKAPNCGTGCEEVSVAVIDQKTGVIAVATQVGTSGVWTIEYSNVR